MCVTRWAALHDFGCLAYTCTSQLKETAYSRELIIKLMQGEACLYNQTVHEAYQLFTGFFNYSNEAYT